MRKCQQGHPISGSNAKPYISQGEPAIRCRICARLLAKAWASKQRKLTKERSAR